MGGCEVHDWRDLPASRAADLGDQLDGSAVRIVAEPSDLFALSQLMSRTSELRLTVLPRGSASKLGWLHLPPVIDVAVDLGRFDLFRYDPATELVHVGAGVPVAMVQDELARFGRRIALDPPSLRATVGGMLATAESGPLAHQFGPPPAHVVDATVVLPEGSQTTVAGREKLLGSGVCDLRWAYPGWPHPASVVAGAVLRTYPVPEASAWLNLPISGPLEADGLRDEILSAKLSPAAIEFDLPGARRGSGARPAAGMVSVLFEGAEAGVVDRIRELGQRLDAESQVTRQGPSWWGRYPFRPGEVALRVHSPDLQLHPLCYALADVLGMPVPIRGSIGSGHAWAALPGELPRRSLLTVLDLAREVQIGRGGTVVVQAAPRDLRDVVLLYRSP